MIVCLDPGHGGDDPGASDTAGRRESDFALAQCMIVESFLRGDGHAVVLTRHSDVRVGLSERAERANRAGAGCLISIHWNASTDPRPNGTIVMCHVQSRRGRQLAEALLAHVGPLDAETNERWERVWAVPDATPGSRWQSSAPTVIARTHAPAVILETEFATHEPSAELLNSDAYRLAVGRAVATGVGEWARLT